ncbi:MAG: LamG domain-containing protein, partial [archaeon]
DFNYLVLNSNNGLDKNGYNYGTQIEPTIEKDLNFGLVGLWHLNEASGTTANDSSVYGNNGTYTNSPTLATGLWDTNARTFDGVNDYITIPSSSSLNTGSNITLSFWAKPTSFTLTSSGDMITIITKGVNADAAMDYFIGLTSSGYLRIYFYSGGVWNGVEVASANPLTLNRWNYITVTFTGSTGKLNVYINGALNKTSTLVVGSIQSSAGPLKIGTYNPGGYYSNYFPGQLEDVAIWNRALDANEIKEIFNKGSSRIGVKYRSCESSSSCTSAWSALSYFSTSNQLSLDSLDGNQFMQYALYPSLYQFPDGNYFPTAFATIRDVNLVYTN